MIAIHEYEDIDGRRPFGRWFDELNIEAAVKVETALASPQELEESPTA